MQFFFQAEDGIRDLVRSRGLGDVYKRQTVATGVHPEHQRMDDRLRRFAGLSARWANDRAGRCLLYTSDAADERSSVDLGGRRIIKKKTIPGAAALCGSRTSYTLHHIVASISSKS